MRTTLRSLVIVACGLWMTSCPASTDPKGASVERVLEELLTIERAALDRWIRLDPSGYLSTFAEEVTYFDPFTPARVSGLATMRERLAPMSTMKPPFTDPRYEILEPRAQRHGTVAVLTFNLVNYGKIHSGHEQVLARWNATEIYDRVDDRWKIVHAHWSYVQPQLKQNGL